MSDDLNTPRALIALDEMLADKKVSPADRVEALGDYDAVLGLRLADLTRAELRVRPLAAGIEAEAVATRLAERREARATKDFARSDAIRDELNAAGVEIRLNANVTALEPLLARGAVVVATGGLSYPTTGSTGDGYRFAQQEGHALVAPKPSLIPLETREQWPKTLQGLSLKNVTLRAEVNGKKRYEEQGEMLFTHFGISGPLTLSMSSHIADDPPEAVRVTLDMKPALTLEQLEARLQREFDASPKKRVASILPALLPARMAEIFPALCAVNGDILCAQVSRADRRKIAETLKKIPMTIKGPRPIDEAIVTRGGVPVSEVSPRDMMSRKRPGLFFAGEVLDVDGHTGGFNLQIAFSTGALAGKSAAAWEENVENY